MNPDPTPVDGTENGLTAPAADLLVIVTTAGLTRAATWTMASELLSWATVWPAADAGVLLLAPIGDATAAGRTSASVASDATGAPLMGRDRVGWRWRAAPTGRPSVEEMYPCHRCSPRC